MGTCANEAGNQPWFPHFCIYVFSKSALLFEAFLSHILIVGGWLVNLDALRGALVRQTGRSRRLRLSF